MRGNQPVTQQESPVQDSDVLISRTDHKGRITYANPVFVEISGFSPEELISTAHNIVRHSDMPKAAFRHHGAGIERVPTTQSRAEPSSIAQAAAEPPSSRFLPTSEHSKSRQPVRQRAAEFDEWEEF